MDFMNENPPGRPDELGDELGLAPEAPDGWQSAVAAVARTTVNAAIMDYHNVQAAQIEKMITELIEKRITEALNDYRVEPASGDGAHEEATEAAAQKAEQTPPGARVELRGTCDKRLFDIFEKERRALGLTASQMIDVALHHYFRRPSLSRDG